MDAQSYPRVYCLFPLCLLGTLVTASQQFPEVEAESRLEVAQVCDGGGDLGWLVLNDRGRTQA